LADQLKHAVQIAHDIAVPEADHPISMSGYLARAGCVCLFAHRVLTAIELYRELEARTGEIDHVTADWVLPAKAVWTIQFAQSTPEPLFYLGRVSPQFASDAGSGP
jgi:hypothetical protein